MKEVNVLQREQLSQDDIDRRFEELVAFETGQDRLLSREHVNQRFADIALELSRDFSHSAIDMQKSFLDLSSQEVQGFNGDTEPSKPLSLKEQYNLKFDPEKTIRGLGSLGVVLVMAPETLTDEIERKSADKISDDEQEKSQETAGMYAQDKSEYQEYVAQAVALVYHLKYGDESGLSAVPARFQGALSVRMNQNCNELQDGTMTQGEFDLEVKKMISVACIGLRFKAEGTEV